jgi:orotidine-5'-phosphate decarboxylase
MAELIVALDVASLPAALSMVDALGDAVDFYKVGSPLFTRTGPSVVQELRDRGKKVFLDLKFHDIPNTVARAVESAASAGVDLLTLHASGGSTMLRAARDAAGHEGPKLLGVTLLTSLSASDVEEAWAKELRSIRDEVSRLAGIAAEAGLDGVVASPLEIEMIRRRHGADFLIVTPGIRPATDSIADHARAATPADAVRAGSDYLVVGRPIVESADPRSAAERILEEMDLGVEARSG